VSALGFVPTLVLGTLLGLPLSELFLYPHMLHTGVREAEPLVAAIHGYVAREGSAPRSLADLVPPDLSEVPTSWLGDGEFHYESVDTDAYPRRWRLRVRFRSRGSAPPSLRYESDENYTPPETPGWTTTPIGRWTYDHAH